jgi:hypothetical protein
VPVARGLLVLLSGAMQPPANAGDRPLS